MSTIEAARDLDHVNSMGWFLAGLDGEGDGWREYVRDDEYPKLTREADRLRSVAEDLQ